MAEEEIQYSIPSEGGGANDGRQVDLIVTYDPTAKNADGSYTVTAARGTYAIVNDAGNVARTDQITQLAATGGLGSNDNKLFIVSDPSSTPIVTGAGINFNVSTPTDANEIDPSSSYYGQVNFFNGNNGTGNPRYVEDGDNGSYATVTQERPFVCFASGTLIQTARGEIAVEALRVEDLAITASGTARPVRWLGHRTIDCRGAQGAAPIRIAAHAFGQGLPARDLYLSPGHPVLVGAGADGEGGHLVPIMCLINGTTVRRVAVERVTYWHIELDAHDILLAEGLPAESYIDLGSRPWFGGADGALYDPDLALPGLPGRCRPVATDGPVVKAERRRLDAVFAGRLASAAAWPSMPDAFLAIF